MTNYAILGGGRLARHFSHYLHLLEIPHTRWTRDCRSSFNSYDSPDAGLRLRKTIHDADQVLLLVSDNAIGAVLKQYPFLHEKRLIHCSGALCLPGVGSAHPLMTFADHLYDLDTYRSVPFVLDAGTVFGEVLPGLPNPHFSIDVADRARYHALCVMAGNFAQVLWKGVADRFEQQLDLPAEALHPYLSRVTANFKQAPASALTGPLARNDRQTIERNMDSLDGDPLQGLYAAFVDFYQASDRQKPSSRGAELEKTA